MLLANFPSSVARMHIIAYVARAPTTDGAGAVGEITMS